MNWFADKLGPAPRRSGNTGNTASRTAAPAQPQKGAAAQKSAPTPQRAVAPPPAPEPEKKKKKGWF